MHCPRSSLFIRWNRTKFNYLRSEKVKVRMSECPQITQRTVNCLGTKIPVLPVGTFTQYTRKRSKRLNDSVNMRSPVFVNFNCPEILGIANFSFVSLMKSVEHFTDSCPALLCLHLWVESKRKKDTRCNNVMLQHQIETQPR